MPGPYALGYVNAYWIGVRMSGGEKLGNHRTINELKPLNESPIRDESHNLDQSLGGRSNSQQGFD